MKNLRSVSIPTLAVVLLFGLSAIAQTGKDTASTQSTIFPQGQKAPAGKTTGTVWVQTLVDNDSTYTLSSGSVTFEPGARTNWHLHPAGQLLLVTAGTGYPQIKGQPKKVIQKGDVVKCPLTYCIGMRPVLKRA